MNALKTSPVWVNWRADPQRGKVPINPLTGGTARTDDPATWSDYLTVERAKAQYEGTGFVFMGGLCGIDIDGTDGHTQENPLATEVLELFRGTYIERSPSGKGYHIIFHADIARLPTVSAADGQTRLDPRYYTKNPHSGLEAYCGGLTKRYFTYTGERVSAGEEITDQTEQVLIFFDRYMQRAAQPPQEPPDVDPLQMLAMLDKVRNSHQGVKFVALYDRGDVSLYNGDESAADQALCDILAWWLQGDPVAIDTAFRGSALYRPKWERADYREATISKAIAQCGGEFYRGRGRPKAQQSGEQKPHFTPDVLTAYLEERGIRVRLNVITGGVDIDGVQGENPEQLKANIAALLYSQLQGRYKGLNMGTVQDYLRIVYSRNAYNPVLELLCGHTWDGVDRLEEVYQVLRISPGDQLSRTLVKKWLWQSLSLLHNSAHKPFGADGVLVLTGGQGVGKTSLFRHLAIMPAFFREGVSLDFRDKDTYIKAVGCWLAELGEIETTLKSDIARLKGFITQDVDEYREAYARGASRSVRRTSFCGTCNSAKFLIDPTGNRRFWTVDVGEGMLDLDRLAALDAIQLWKQVETWAQKDMQGFRLTWEEQRQLAARNTDHEKPIKGEDEIRDILSTAHGDGAVWEYMTVTQFKNYYERELRQYTVNQVSAALDKLGHLAERKTLDGRKQRVRTLPRRTVFTLTSP